MAIVINGSGTVTGITVGGLPDGIVDAGTLATNSVDSAELIDGSVDNSHLADDAVDSDEIAAGSIDEAHIADNAVTLAKMASGTDGNIISYDASGNPVAIATGTDGQVLTSTGAGSPPAFEDTAGGGGGSGWTYLSTINASGSTVDFDSDFSSTYDDYMVVINDWNGQYTGHDFYCLVKQGSWVTGQYYHWNSMYMTIASSTVSITRGGGTNASTYIKLTGINVSSADADGVSMVVHIPNVHGDSKKTLWAQGGFGRQSDRCTVFTSAAIDSTSAIDGIRFKLSNGTMGGVFKLYGLAKS